MVGQKRFDTSQKLAYSKKIIVFGEDIMMDFLIVPKSDFPSLFSMLRII